MELNEKNFYVETNRKIKAVRRTEKLEEKVKDFEWRTSGQSTRKAAHVRC